MAKNHNSKIPETKGVKIKLGMEIPKRPSTDTDPKVGSKPPKNSSTD